MGQTRGESAYNRRLIEASLDPLVTIGPDGKITDVNTATEHVTGLPREALVGTDFSDYFTEPDRARAGYRQVFRDGFVRDYPLELRHRDGSVTSVLYNASTYRDEHGEVIGVFAAARDVTERRRAEEALRVANAYNRSLIETSLDPLVTIGPDGKVTDVNTATESVTGLPRAELVGTDFSDYFTEPEKARVGYQQAFRDGFVRDYALELRHRDGHTTPVLYNASTYKDSLGKVIGVFAAARDVTEQRRAEQRMEAETALRLEKERLLIYQSRLAAMGEMIGAIAHQWRQPINAVGAIIQDLAEASDAGELDAAYVRRSAEGAMSQIRYMSKTIDDFRNFFRPEKASRPFSLRRAIEDSFGLLARQLSAGGVEAVIASDDLEGGSRSSADGITIIGHENEMKQVLLNLISNAKDSIEERWRQALGPAEEPGRITAFLGRQPSRAVIRIVDNGAGIPPALMDRIFDPYFTTKEPGRGTGVGLYMAKVIVESARGSLTARNLPGGAEFRIEVPDGY